MAPIAVKIENLSKKYVIPHERPSYLSLREVISKKFKNFIHPNVQSSIPKTEEIWALKDVSLEIKQGDRVGIIGRNGAGKTTLLKVLSRITEPTKGRITIKGRVASLLEVGTGFHPELTGRENIFLNGAILGMSKAEIIKKFDEIISFAEVEKFLDTPIKHFSSGMYVRLAFAVAAHLEPEILIVDEVLAVGDIQFQKKCLGKMGAVAEEGRTVLFVSHNMAAVQSLCNQAICLKDGRLIDSGNTDEVVFSYLKTVSTTLLEQKWDDTQSAPGNENVRLNYVRLSPEQEPPSNEITVKTPLKFEVEYWNLKSDVNLNMFFLIYNIEGICIFGSTTIDEPNWGDRPFPIGLFRNVCQVPGNLLNDGFYRIKIAFVKDHSIVLFRHEDVILFEVHDVERPILWVQKWPGTVRPILKWETTLLKDGE